MAAEPMERSRSNSESVVNSRAAKRMGFVVRRNQDLSTVSETSARAPPPQLPPLLANGIPPNISSSRTSVKQSGVRQHTRGVSHDSVMESSYSPKEEEQEPNAYFRRLSVLQEQMSPSALAMLSMAAFCSQVVESARGVLFTLSQVVPAVRQFLVFCDDRKLSGTLTGVLYNAKLHTDALIRTLEHHDALLSPGRRGPPATSAIEPVIHAALSCISTFRRIISLVHANIKTLAAHAEIRHTRSFFLVSFGALAEVHNAWTKLLPALAECRVPVSVYMTRDLSSHSTKSEPSSELMPPPALPLPSLPATFRPTPISGMASPINSNGLFLPSGLFSPMAATTSTPLTENGPYAFHFSIEPSDSDEELFERIDVATQSALNVLSLMHEEIVPGDDPKMKELANICDSGLDVTRRLRERLVTIRGADAVERSRFGEETNAFVRGIINTLEFTKTILNDYPFLNDARPQLSSLTRVTKEVLTVTLKPEVKSSPDKLT